MTGEDVAATQTKNAGGRSRASQKGSAIDGAIKKSGHMMYWTLMGRRIKTQAATEQDSDHAGVPSYVEACDRVALLRRVFQTRARRAPSAGCGWRRILAYQTSGPTVETNPGAILP